MNAHTLPAGVGMCQGHLRQPLLKTLADRLPTISDKGGNKKCLTISD